MNNAVKKLWESWLGLTFANKITISRLALSWVPALFILNIPINDNCRWGAVTFFLLVVMTDFLDGHYARLMNQVTDLGKILDPLVDKVLIILTLLALCRIDHEVPHLLDFTVVVIIREVWVSIQRHMSKQQGVIVASSWAGKAKMAIQCVAIAVIIIVILVPPSGVVNAVIIGVINAGIWATMMSWVVYEADGLIAEAESKKTE
jgi:CDP-diacylglycerol---glycerol-3-phosphate 3-phosphatidyltransferase